MGIVLFGRIRDLRIKSGLTQKEIAQYLSVSRSTYSACECGKQKIRIGVLLKLAKLYHTSVDYLVGLTDDPIPHE